ncbi:Predicted O-methyltransferase YrrM [Enhydrobacter aerosaccus]|uniref:Predicted O-methyltransferase YrrM n=1 Tax=Enhydrobacter aerosaccus TaxID=225324 RepID=A0A1T4L792_9HYPH|nr:class I SAM-dependent methyltransferase [Enhydrobacter aerosaccus]SJZ50498.1 Predicted O-methyltransferase YrrM [Enhydrobacter aerosaccus]
MKTWTNVDGALATYIDRNWLRESPLKQRLRQETARMPGAGMQISAHQGQQIGLLARAIGARRAVEVGTFTGYSSICIAEALPADGKLWCCDVSEDWTAIARRYWAEAGVEDRIALTIAPALRTLDGLLSQGLAGRLDLAFIDANKSDYDAYYERCLELVRPGGIILIDNVLWGGSVADPADKDADTQAIRALNAKLRADNRIDLALTVVGDGMTCALKR